MNFYVEDAAEDFGTLVIHPGRDDAFTVSGYNDGGITIRLPLYNYQARELIGEVEKIATLNGDEEA